MINLVKNLKNHWKVVIVIFALLVIQAYCELSLPQYTSDIVDVGIASYGIEDVVMDEISKASYDKLSVFMTSSESEIFEKYYTLEDDRYKLNDITDSEKSELEKAVKNPMIAVYIIENSDSMTIESLESMPGIQKRAIYKKLVEGINSMGEDSADNAAIKFVIEEYKSLGTDVTKMQTAYMLKTGAAMLAIALVAMACAVMVGLLSSRTAAKVGRELRKNVFEKVISFSNTEMDKFSTASLITRSTNDIQQVQMVTVMMLKMVMYAPIMGVGGVLKVLGTDTSLTWIIAVGVATVLTVVMVLFLTSMPKFNKMQTLVDKVNLVAREILTGIPVIRAFSREKHEEERFAKSNKELMNTQLFTNRVMSCMMPLMMFIMNIISVIIIWFGGKGVDAGNLQVGDMMAFITYAMQIIMSFLMISMISIMLPRAGVAAGRINEVLNTVPVINDPENVKHPGGEGVVKFDNVSFAYPNAKENVLENISFEARPGQTTAFIGSTGCGKSTLINLIPRFYDVTDGKVTIDGVDVRDLSQKELRDMIGYVPQKAVLFSGTIASNIRFGNEQASLDEVKEAVRIAQSADFVEEKEDTYESRIAQGGTNVSGGQKQRLSIARAIAKKPKIYIFDDSFSALDFKTDRALREELAKETENSTVIIVAQRISTILGADQIIVLDDGKIAGMGKHAYLMKNCEIYKQIAESQLSKKDLEALDEEV